MQRVAGDLAARRRRPKCRRSARRSRRPDRRRRSAARSAARLPGSRLCAPAPAGAVAISAPSSKASATMPAPVPANNGWPALPSSAAPLACAALTVAIDVAAIVSSAALDIGELDQRLRLAGERAGEIVTGSAAQREADSAVGRGGHATGVARAAVDQLRPGRAAQPHIDGLVGRDRRGDVGVAAQPLQQACRAGRAGRTGR